MKWQIIKKLPSGQPRAVKSENWTVCLNMVDGLSMYCGFYKEDKTAAFMTDEKSEINERIKAYEASLK